VVAPDGADVGFADKAALLAGGSAVSASTYERASKDKRKQGKSVTDQRRFSRALAASMTSFFGIRL